MFPYLTERLICRQALKEAKRSPLEDVFRILRIPYSPFRNDD